MNFLQLAQRLHLLLRIGKDNPGTAPESVTGQTGLLGELVEYIRQSWVDIQMDCPDWLFMQKSTSLILPEGQNQIDPYAAIDDLDAIKMAVSDNKGRFITLYADNIADETPVRYVPYQDFAYSYLNRGERGPGQPGWFTIAPNGRLLFDIVADKPYTLRIDYRRTPQVLAENTDVPIMPAVYHQLIVSWAIVNYYCLTRDDTNELRAKANENLKRERTKLRNEQLPEVLGFEVDP